MTAEVQKKNPHQHGHHHHHQQSHPHKKMVSLKSLERITNLPVVESAHAYYEKIKNSNTLIKWSLIPAETGVWLAVETAMPVVNYFEKPVTAIDTIFCHGLDVIEANLPIVTYPPDLVYNITKDYVNSKVVSPMLKRADSVKQLSISGANNFGEIAASRLNNAIDVADQYVEKYLPDISDAPDSTTEPSSVVENPKNKTAKTIQHVNQFGRKLQRRLTRRTIAEAKALKQQGADTIRCLVYLVDLLSSDPKLFVEKAKEMWLELSKDEPENQVPPANMEQLVAMLTREIARRVVHITNYTGAKIVVLSQYGLQVAHIGALNTVWWADHLIKAMHLESVVETTTTLIIRIHHVSIDLLDRLMEIIKNLKKESLKSAGNEASAVAPQQPLCALMPPPPQSTTTTTAQLLPRPSSISSCASFSSASSTASSPTKTAPTSQNGDTHTALETKHEKVTS